MRNNIYCNKFIIKENYIEDNITGIRYIHSKDIIYDNNCFQVCDDVKRKTCEVLNKADSITPIKILRSKDTDSFGDEKDNYKRKLK